eukprot:1158744-Pelagomonas_calceolata.AAC.2
MAAAKSCQGAAVAHVQRNADNQAYKVDKHGLKDGPGHVERGVEEAHGKCLRKALGNQCPQLDLAREVV